MPIGRRLQPKKQGARMAQGAFPTTHAGTSLYTGLEGNPDPGIPGDFRQFLQLGQVVFLLGMNVHNSSN